MWYMTDKKGSKMLQHCPFENKKFAYIRRNAKPVGIRYTVQYTVALTHGQDNWGINYR